MLELTSQNKRILIVADPHQDMGILEYILKHENYDIAVCLGDFFDSMFHNSESDVEATCKFLKKWIFKDNFYTVWGNHDFYLYDSPFTICSGYEKSKDDYIGEVLGNFLIPIREKFLWALWVDDRLCSHAGINEYFFPPNLELTKKGISEWLDRETQKADLALISCDQHWAFLAGKGRGGRQKIGGLTWQDWLREFRPIEGVKQICGHSYHKNIVGHPNEGIVDLTQADNLCIDCNLSAYLIIENGKIEIKKFINL